MRHRTTYRNLGSLPTLVGFIGFFVLLVMAGCAEPQQQPAAEPEVTDPLARGQASYEQYCQNCHGVQAQGDGPVASLLTVPPPDLTQLAAKHGGTFPIDYVYSTIDGREQVQSHGTRTMPVWGNVWLDTEGGPDAEEHIRQQINELAEYLRTLQATDAG